MTGTTEGGKKAAETRGHESLSEAGRKGGEHSHGGHSQQTQAQNNTSHSSKNEQSGQGRGSNLSDEDRRKGGEHSPSGGRHKNDNDKE